LLWTGAIDEPLGILIYSRGAVVVTLVYFLLPFAVLPIYGSMRAIPDDLIEVARDLGATAFGAARDVVLPLSERGINVAFLFSFLISAGDYVTPRFVGGGASMMGHFIETQFSFGFNWPMGSAMSFTLLAASLLTVVCFRLALHRGVAR
jgi:spermidine/putrescine transport system permease protein